MVNFDNIAKVKIQKNIIQIGQKQIGQIGLIIDTRY